MRLAMSRASAWRQWDWSKEVCDRRNSTSCMFIYRCDSIVFYMLGLMYRYWLLFMYISVSLQHHLPRLAYYCIG